MRLARLASFGLTALALLEVSPSVIAEGRNPGSLLIFPEFDNRVASLTMFTVTNTNTDTVHNPVTNLPQGTIKVHFIYVGRYDSEGNPIPCLEANSTVTLTPGDTFTFLTSTHNPEQKQGFMYAYAQHPTTNKPYDFDYLIGNAIFLSGIEANDYSTNPISLLAQTGGDTDIDNDGNRDLDAIEYEQLPDEILVPRFLGVRPSLRSDLILLGLSGGAAFDTVVDFVVYNDNEEPFSAQRQFRCWERVSLETISSVFRHDFLAATNQDVGEPLGATGRESGWFSMNGATAYSTVEQINDPAIYGVLIDTIKRASGAGDLPFEYGNQSNGSLWPNGPLGDNVLGDNR
ncbi:MAG: hypothetical protein ACKVXR_11550 [Planctomycetota bacterium]